MLALTLDGCGTTMNSTHPGPVRRPGEALIRMNMCGICDTDLQLSAGYMGFRGIPGHEFVGKVVEADDGAWVGKRVVADINAGCGSCTDCIERDGHHCPTRTVLGISGRGGAMAEQLAVPQQCLVEVPDTVTDEQAVFSEPLAAALHVLDALPHGADHPSSVAVLGDGKLGLLIALALAQSRVSVTSIGHHESKLKLLKGRVQTTLDQHLTRHDFDVVVEATGSEAGLARAIELVRPRGTVVLKTTVKGKLSLDLAPLVINELTLVGSRCGDLARAIDALRQGDIDPTCLIAARYPLSQAREALAHAARPGVLKVLIEATESFQ